MFPLQAPFQSLVTTISSPCANRKLRSEGTAQLPFRTQKDQEGPVRKDISIGIESMLRRATDNQLELLLRSSSLASDPVEIDTVMGRA